MITNDIFIQQASELIAHYGDDETYFIIFADITNFHTVNRIYGMQEGNALLQQVEDILSQWPNLRLCKRVFADYFLGLYALPKDTQIHEVLHDNDLKVQAFLDEWRKTHPACNLRAACGICEVNGNDITKIIDNANVARKIAKKGLFTKAIPYDKTMELQNMVQYESEKEIYAAMQEERFCFELQPKVNLTNGEMIGAEALVRLKGKHGELLYPKSFIKQIEKSRAILQLDQIIYRQVCIFLANRIQQHLPVMPISVNLSRLHIQDTTTADRLHQIALTYGIPSSLLEFELTETILLEELSGAKRLINQLRAYGYRICIDDYGSGYTGMNIWQELNFDCLKLDCVFLSEDPSKKERNEALVPNIINIAQRLHVQVICEGVETAQQCTYLFRMGCSIVQGYYFSKPLPPEELFEIYTKANKAFPLPASLLPATIEEQVALEETQKSKQFNKKKTISYLLVVLLCTFFLGICITSVLLVNRNQTQQEFSGMVKENLNAYTDGQRESTILEIEGIKSTLDSMAVLFEENDDEAFIESYLLTLNQSSNDIFYAFDTLATYEEALRENSAPSGARQRLAQLRKGEAVVSDIIYSERLQGGYYIAIGVPVMKDGNFIGAVRGIIDAQTLISTELYNPAQGEIAAVFLTDGDSKILPVRKEGGKAVGQYLLDRMQNWGIDTKTMEEIKTAFLLDNDQANSVRIGVFDGAPYYISMTGLKYNDWHLVVCLKADKMLAHSQRIVQDTIIAIILLLIALLLVAIVIIFFIRKMQKKFSFDEKRYLLLERFSDTALFDYDVRSDTIRFTSNSAKLFRVYELIQKGGEAGQLNLIYVYASDQYLIRQLLEGDLVNTEKEIRVRLLRPDTDDYFWSLIQYQYLYERGKFVSVIGKITDIDEYMRKEEHLSRLAERDGLTELFNKVTAERMCKEKLSQIHQGALYIVDVDDFKHINDQYGHAIGDATLQFIAECMRKTFHRGAILGRIGGDELSIFADDIIETKTAQKKAEQLQVQLRSCTKEGIPSIRISIGIAFAPKDGATYEELYRAADQALYAAKQNGKCQIFFYEHTT